MIVSGYGRHRESGKRKLEKNSEYIDSTIGKAVFGGYGAIIYTSSVVIVDSGLATSGHYIIGSGMTNVVFSHSS